jgi:hypothetical protein
MRAGPVCVMLAQGVRRRAMRTLRRTGLNVDETVSWVVSLTGIAVLAFAIGRSANLW